MIKEQPRVGRISGAWLCASVAGGVVVGAELLAFGFWALFTGGRTVTANQILVTFGQGVLFAGLTAFAAAVVFAVGLIVVGGPAWWALHRLGARTWPVAAVAGAALSFAAGAVILGIIDQTPFGWEEIAAAAWLILPGAAAGWTLHRVAYGGSGAKTA